MSDEHLRALERSAQIGGKAEFVAYCDALNRVGLLAPGGALGEMWTRLFRTFLSIKSPLDYHQLFLALGDRGQKQRSG